MATIFSMINAQVFIMWLLMPIYMQVQLATTTKRKGSWSKSLIQIAEIENYHIIIILPCQIITLPAYTLNSWTQLRICTVGHIWAGGGGNI